MNNNSNENIILRNYTKAELFFSYLWAFNEPVSLQTLSSFFKNVPLLLHDSTLPDNIINASGGITTNAG